MIRIQTTMFAQEVLLHVIHCCKTACRCKATTMPQPKAEFEKQVPALFRTRPRTKIAAQACERHTGQR
jgi:hypothetical protein